MPQAADRADAPDPHTRPAGPRFAGSDRRQPLRQALQQAGQYGPGQTAGRFYPMACVSLEVTQRCNLDCRLCYLSDRAELAHDVPLRVLFDRIRMVRSHYGPGTPVQISGGDPTLRSAEDLEAICREIRGRGLRSCLMTNGIRASRALLARLAAAGLDDVAFHVDLTQDRKGYDTEVSLNPVRAKYIRRAEGLGLRVLFNTTVFDGNLHELPVLARFFRDHAATVALASFQMQADTGRGVLRDRAAAVTPAALRSALAEGMGCALDFDSAAIGHEACSRYASVLVAGRSAVSALADRRLLHDLFAGLETVERPVEPHLELRATLRRLLPRRPLLTLRLAWHCLALFWRLRRGLPAARFRPARLSLLVHDFMDATDLDAERCRACVFMVMTAEGPLSMCVHNAARDRHLFAPARVETAAGRRWWDAASGRLATARPEVDPAALPLPRKRLKGRLRAAAGDDGR
ncbi:radical SAM protein [Marinibaculum pumilum]|uniref:Radical SAM protein n=1 Tax=Marinibaculum pumilum TaxID=1766165 RepID=A0ABV7KZ77_9PROT